VLNDKYWTGPVRFVRIKKFIELTGYTEKAVRGKIHEAVWLEGKHFRRAPDGNICINLEAYDAWVRGLEGPST
jgi:hypothetical protein